MDRPSERHKRTIITPYTFSIVGVNKRNKDGLRFGGFGRANNTAAPNTNRSGHPKLMTHHGVLYLT
jgi:hypothetical protein